MRRRTWMDCLVVSFAVLLFTALVVLAPQPPAMERVMKCPAAFPLGQQVFIAMAGERAAVYDSNYSKIMDCAWGWRERQRKMRVK